MPYQISILGVYMPTMVALCLAGIGATWIINHALLRLKVYKHVWHPALLQAGILAGICAAFGLVVYH